MQWAFPNILLLFRSNFIIFIKVAMAFIDSSVMTGNTHREFLGDNCFFFFSVSEEEGKKLLYCFLELKRFNDLFSI